MQNWASGVEFQAHEFEFQVRGFRHRVSNFGVREG